MGINIFSKKNIWKFVSFVLLIIFGNIDFFIIRSGVAKGIVNAFKWLFNFMNHGVPNFVTNLLLVVALGCLVFLSIKTRALLRAGSRGLREDSEGSKEDTGNLRDDFEEHKEVFKKVTSDMDKNIRGIRQDLSGIYDKAKRYEKIETKEEIMFILKTIGARRNKIIDEAQMFAFYIKRFKFTTTEEAKLGFNMNINWLDRNDYIKQFIPDYDDDDGIVELLQITDKGFEYLRISEMKIEEKKGNSQ